jgi:hypothetical protein
MPIKTIGYINFELMNTKIVKSPAGSPVTNNFSTLLAGAPFWPPYKQIG